MTLNINYYVIPPRLKLFRNSVDKDFAILDVGCGNASVLQTKKWYPRCRYFGLDLSRDSFSSEELSHMEKLFIADLDCDDLGELPDAHFDVIVMSHVIEHVRDGLSAVERLTKKLAPRGRIYIEFPSVRSLGLPSARRTLQFCDDPTHVRVYSVKEVANVLLANGLKVTKAGRRREWLRIALSPLTIPSQIKTLLTEGRLDAVGLWDLCGFADYVYAEKPNSGIVSIHPIQVTFMSSGAVGDATLHYGGRRYPFKFRDLARGASTLDATGSVYNLCCLGDSEGVYGQVRTGWAIDSQRKGEMWLQNSNGVYLQLKARREGLSLTVAPDGILVRLGA